MICLIYGLKCEMRLEQIYALIDFKEYSEDMLTVHLIVNYYYRFPTVMLEAISAPSEGSALAFFPQLFDILLLMTAVISTLVSLLIPCLFYLKKQCREHPTVLIANISLLESIANFNIVLMAVDIFAYEGVVRINDIFAMITFGLVDMQPKTEDTDLCIYNYCVYMLVELLSISFHICYAVDLLLTIKLPFFTGKKRRKYYYLFSVILLVVTLANSFEEASDICQNELAVQSIYKVPLWFLITLVVFCVISIVIILMSFFQRGQARIRKEYIRHHRIILILLVLMWLPPIYSNFLIRLDQTDSPYFDIVNKLSFFCIIALTGVISIVRMIYDKFLREKIREMICRREESNIHRESISEDNYIQLTQKQPVNEQVWNLPLSQAMKQFQSQQIVHNIIQVVCEACAAHQPIKNSNVRESTIARESIRNSTMLYESVYRNTILLETDEEEDASLRSIFGKGKKQRYQKMNPHEATVDDLKELCKKKRKFNMVCLAPEEEQSEMDRLSQKTVHITNNLIKTQQYKEEAISNMLNIKVTSYSHRVFETLREYDNLPTDTIIETLNLEKNVQSIKKAKESLGASGSFFFFSFDHKIVIKTIAEQQKDRFIEILPYYFDHIRYNECSLLARTYGIFSIQIAGISKIYFIMMQNAFEQLEEHGMRYRVYDMKGSTVQREVKDPHAAVFKDINYFKSADCFLFLSKESKLRLIDDITKDIDMLKQHNIMDYSLLLGVAKSKNQIKRKDLFARGVGIAPRHSWRYLTELEDVTRRVYSISLIDYLQEFNFSKKMELWLKRIFKGGGDISSVDTDIYYRRFLTFLNRIILVFNAKFQTKKPVFRVAEALTASRF